MRIGVIGVQGDVSEHVDAVVRAMREAGKPGEAIAVRRRKDLDRVDALTIPGGESTTISKLLALMDMAVDRNAFGRQRESFEADFEVEGLEKPFHGVFIRAPAILRTWGDCKSLARCQDRIVLAREKNLIGAAFHPELSGDLRIHRGFLDLI